MTLCIKEAYKATMYNDHCIGQYGHTTSYTNVVTFATSTLKVLSMFTEYSLCDDD